MTSPGDAPRDGRRSLASNLAGSLATQVVSWTVGMLVNLFVPNYLAPEQFARLALVGTLAAGIATMAGSGVNQYLVREVARSPERAGSFLQTAVIQRIILMGCGTFVAAALAIAMRCSREVVLLATIGTAVGTLAQLNTILVSVLQGLELFGRGNASVLVERTAIAVAQIGLVIARQPLWTFVVVPGISVVVSIAMNLRVLRRGLRSTMEPSHGIGVDRGLLRELNGHWWIFAAGCLMYAIWEPVNQLLLLRLSDEMAGGWYALTRRLVGTALFIPASLASVTLPRLSRLYGIGNREFCDAVRSNLRTTMLCMVPISASCIFAAESILDTLHYLPKYAGAVPVFRMFGGGLVLWFLSQIVGFSLIASDRQAGIARFTIYGAALVPCIGAVGVMAGKRMLGNGAMGAVAADIVIETFLLVNYLRLLPRDGRPMFDLSYVGRLAVASLPCIAILASASGREDIWRVPLGCAAFALAALALRCWTLGEARSVLSGFNRRESRA